jgi:glyceraldehyde 3-phosphate dehydrogenase
VFRVAINGFGRIGRIFCRIAASHPEIEIAAINASYDSRTLAHLLKYDTVHGRYTGEVGAGPDHLLVDGRPIRLVSDRDPANLPWSSLGINLVIEATGKFRDRAGASRHLAAGARRVLITAPAKGEDLTVVMGVNEDHFDPSLHKIVSGASCTTNALAPLARVLHESFGIISGLMTSIHSYTSDQNIVDNPHKDLRRARGAAQAIIPTSTGAAQAVAKVLPALAGLLNGFALRVPTPDVSVVDLTVRLAAPASAAEVNLALQGAARGALAGVLGFSEEPLVSADYIGDSRSAIVDGASTLVGPDGMTKVIAWYDNEWGYASRIVDLAAYIAAAEKRVRTLSLAGD